MSISIVILTRNEQLDLPGCLASVAWSDDVHVFDSFSTDETVTLAERTGAKVTQRVFDNYAAQRNAALHEVKYRHAWVLLLDADERVPAELAAELRDFARTAPPDVAAARIRRRDFFQNRWLKHAQMSPFFIRLVRPAQARYEREVNEVVRVDGKIRDLRMPYDHFPFSKGLDHWMARHNRYATMEARVALQGAGGARPSLARALWAKDFNERRFHQKGLFLKMPFRPFIKLFYLMAVRRAFLDGRPGVTYAVLQSIYEYLIILKMRELRTAPAAVSTSGPPPPPGGTVATDHRTILGINFFVGSAGEAVRLGLKGGLVVAPAAPALVKLSEDEHYRTAVTEANLAITDSAFMVMLWNLTQRDRIRRISGLEYLVLLLAELKRQPDESMFLVMPGSASAELTVAWLTAQGFAAGRVDTYVAPRYSGKEIADAELLQMLEQKRPAQIIIGLGGGTQEKLGLFLRRGLNYAPGIHCIGAAIGFLTGDQVRIPLWADHLYLGWLFRCVDQPRNYIPRYWTARKLARLMVKNGARIPE